MVQSYTPLKLIWRENKRKTWSNLTITNTHVSACEILRELFVAKNAYEMWKIAVGKNDGNVLFIATFITLALLFPRRKSNGGGGW